MKDLIKKILKEETSDIKPALIKAFYTFMEMKMETEGYEIYVETPENRFRHWPDSIWIINPKTKEWVVALKKSGELLYYYKFHQSFIKWFNEERSVFERLITIWVEDVLKRGVSTIRIVRGRNRIEVENVLKRGIKIS
jgi:arginyl-tRNA--protein-N-Asp/Glu arginylyltransferase